MTGARPTADVGPTFRGQLRAPGGVARAGRIALGDTAFTLGVEGAAPATIAYRDLATIAVDHEVGLLALGTGAQAERWLLDRFGPGLGPLVGALRERRLRQLLGDALVEVPDGPVDLLEYGLPDGSTGVAHLVLHGWGLVIAPLDEAEPWVRVRRARIGAVTERREVGGVRVDDASGASIVELLRLGPAAARHRLAIEALRDSAALDAGRIMEALVPDLAYVLRRRAAVALVDGTPADAATLGDGWTALEASVLAEPVFAASYTGIVSRAGHEAPRWLAVAPESPGSASTRAWFLVGLPGNLVALELVSAGAHATYLFRVVPRAARETREPFDGAALTACVCDISDALVDARFLREPMALTAERLAAPEARRYRLALAAIPSLAGARRRFVARIVHADAATWAGALDDLVAWHDSCHDDDAEWPGRAGQEAAVSLGGMPAAAGDDAAPAARPRPGLPGS